MINKSPSFEKIIAVTREILQIQDLDILLENILTEARKIVHADAGSIYIIENNQLKFSYTQNDTLQKQLPAGNKLIYNTFSIPIDRKSIAGYVAATSESINIKDAYHIEPTKTYSFDPHFDNVSKYKTVSMLTVPLVTVKRAVVGVIQLINAKSINNAISEFPESQEALVHYFADNAASAIERAKMTRAMIMRMIKMAELRDPTETFGHVNRVATYAVEIYEAWAHSKGIAEAEIQHNRDILHIAAMLHDVGKIAISDNILKKPGALTPEERVIMQQHTIEGAKLFQDSYSDFDEACAIVALNHHERWDGKGYPRNIATNTIPLFGRIVSIADVFDALSSNRSYKSQWTEEDVLKKIREEAGIAFDPELVNVFFSCLDMIRIIKSRYPSTT